MDLLVHEVARPPISAGSRTLVERVHGLGRTLVRELVVKVVDVAAVCETVGALADCVGQLLHHPGVFVGACAVSALRLAEVVVVQLLVLHVDGVRLVHDLVERGEPLLDLLPVGQAELLPELVEEAVTRVAEPERVGHERACAFHE